ncbi:hypothetical protein [Vibrio owensii]|uniref:hypothetical protein n=1 Tax=Vibrio owensii TaxID=696485 RepID=UPI0018F20F0C|nr:hypothetical protein [Vibrio owensii]
MSILNKTLSLLSGNNTEFNFLDSMITQPLTSLIVTGNFSTNDAIQLLFIFALTGIGLSLATKLAMHQMQEDARNIEMGLAGGKPSSTFSFLATEVRNHLNK